MPEQIQPPAELANGLRTYRPSLSSYVFCSISLKEQAIKWLEGVKTGQSSRALLISGPTGYGKTTLAKALCKELGIADRDFNEINSASTRGIDDAKNLIVSLNFAPTDGQFRILLLDEVHQMTSAAQQAFLAPLEQLPKSSIVIACSSNGSDLLPAFRGRFFELQIPEYSENDIVDVLSQLPVELKGQDIVKIAKATQNPREAISFVERGLDQGAAANNLTKISATADNFIEALFLRDFKKLFVLSMTATLVNQENRAFFFEKLLKYLESAWLIVNGLNTSLSGNELAVMNKALKNLIPTLGNVDEPAEKQGSRFIALCHAEFLGVYKQYGDIHWAFKSMLLNLEDKLRRSL